MNMNTNQTKLHTLGIDIGSTTVKVAILNEKNENTVPDNGLEEKEFDESGEVSNDVSDNGLSGDTQDIFAESEKEKGEE